MKRGIKILLIILGIILILAIFFFPKSCGGAGSIGDGRVSITNCDCIGIKAKSLQNYFGIITDYVPESCYGICLKNSCETKTGE